MLHGPVRVPDLQFGPPGLWIMQRSFFGCVLCSLLFVTFTYFCCNFLVRAVKKLNFRAAEEKEKEQIRAAESESKRFLFYVVFTIRFRKPWTLTMGSHLHQVKLCSGLLMNES